MDQDILNKYIKGDASEQEREQVFLWMQADREHGRELAALRRLYDIHIWNQQEKKTGDGVFSRRRLFRIASVAAAFAVLLGISVSLFMQHTPESIMQTINVPPGQRVEVLLADGSSVWLNSGSSFSFPTDFSKKSREVWLDGQGYFDVKKDGKRTFVVKTPAYSVQVLGTTFDLKAYSRDNAFEVSLLSGFVDVFSADSAEPIRLEPDTRAYLVDNKLEKGKIEYYDQFLWKDGLICFDDEPFEKMIDKLKLYFDTEIIIADRSLATGKYTGKFRAKDGLEHILRVIQRKENFIYEKDPDKNRITIR